MAERLGTGLQNRLQRFESARDLQIVKRTPTEKLGFFGFNFILIMLLNIVFSSILSFFNIILLESPNYYQSELDNIVNKFRVKIMNKEECEKLKNEASNIYNDISEILLNNEDYENDSNEIKELKILRKKANAIEQYISVVGNCSYGYLEINNINIANKYIGANINYVLKDEYCIDFITVEIENYVTYLVVNNKSKDYIVNYEWSDKNKISTGSGEMSVPKNHIKRIFNNRENPNLKKISLYGINCKEY